jgi:hypothetical protein
VTTGRGDVAAFVLRNKTTTAMVVHEFFVVTITNSRKKE